MKSKNRYKSIFCLIVFLGIQGMFVSAQTRLGIAVGMDALKLSSLEVDYQNCHYENSGGCIEKGFQIAYPLIGLQFEQQINEKTSLNYQGFYTKREQEYFYFLHTIGYNINGGRVKHDFLTHQLTFSRHIFKDFTLNLGVGYQQYRKITSYLEGIYSFGLPDSIYREVRTIDNQNQLGGVIGLGYRLKGFRFQTQYFHGFNNSEKVNWEYTWEHIHIEPARSFQLSIGYVFTLFDRIRLFSEKEDCPTY